MYYIIWIEGLEPFNGEKIKSLTRTDHTYTTYMTRSLRVKPKDRLAVRKLLASQGIAESFITFVETSYAPKGKIFKNNLTIKETSSIL